MSGRHGAVVGQAIGAVRLADGTRVAYATSGGGPPLLFVPGWVSHVELGWALTPERRFYEGLSQGRTLVRYDRPGCGLSDAAPDRDLVELEMEVIAAVTARLDIGRFDVLGTSMSVPLAVRWAASRPETVDRLVLCGGWADGGRIAEPEVRAHLLGLVRQHWGLGSEVLTGFFAPDADAAFRAALAAHQRHSASAADAERLLGACYSMSVVGDLSGVRARTHVIHREGDRAAPLREARRLADGIPGARLTLLPGRAHMPFDGDAEGLLAAIRRCLDLPALPPPVPSEGAVLTARQLEVARLVAGGLTNRDIAARLVLSERSVESHVDRIRARLGFRSRAQVAAWYATTHPTAPS
ncbi:alpha/beta fold hydrolase [Terrabacter sp. NPDC080008]|uniref:alpha/beta fold hydrolase n=1 Tax=Terrabacter sp. NPDC080008 TaxID=3155176 RepID=UPI00344C2955